jgi:hypothetical protein
MEFMQTAVLVEHHAETVMQKQQVPGYAETETKILQNYADRNLRPEFHELFEKN